jgi:hypothetical protein
MGQGSGRGIHAQFSRLDFPRFSGEDSTVWNYKVKQFFQYQGKALDKKLLLPSFHLQEDVM